MIINWRSSINSNQKTKSLHANSTTTLPVASKFDDQMLETLESKAVKSRRKVHENLGGK